MSKVSRRTRRRPVTVQAADHATAGGRLVLASPDPVGVDVDARILSGVVVPFGQVGETSGGRLRFKAGSLHWTDPKRVKLLREHDQHDVLGFAVEFTETAEKLHGRFYVPEGDNGDRALREAADGLRDGLSVGVQLSDTTLQKLRRTQPGGVVDAEGNLRETSQVSVPAFDDARLAANADLVVSSWAPQPSTGAAGAGTVRGNHTVTAVTTSEPATTVPVTPTPAPAADPPSGTPAPAINAAAAAPSSPATPPVAPTGPAVLNAVAGAAYITAAPATYTFTSGDSLVRDLYNSGVRGDGQARERVERFNAELRDGNPASCAALVTAAATTTDVDGAGTDLPPGFGGGTQWRPDLMRTLVDPKRPFISRLQRIPLSDPRPFAIPKVGEFTGVGAHTEGTPHRAAGTLSLSGSGVVQPTATSGAWEVSRELLDSANPALDPIAVRAMIRDYTRQTEGKVIALFSALANRTTYPTTTVVSVNTLIELRAELLKFVNDDEEGADIIGVSKGLLQTYLTELDTTTRPQIPYVNPTNTVGTLDTGYVGFNIDGVDVFRAARIDTAASLGATYGVLARSQGLLWAESPVTQFRFEEVLGPGVVKLALWAYNAAAVIDTADIKLITSGA